MRLQKTEHPRATMKIPAKTRRGVCLSTFWVGLFSCLPETVPVSRRACESGEACNFSDPYYTTTNAVSAIAKEKASACLLTNYFNYDIIITKFIEINCFCRNFGKKGASMHQFNQKLLRSIALLCALFIALSGIAGLAEEQAIVLDSSIKVYSDAKLTHRVGKLSRFEVVTVADVRGGVTKVLSNGRTGFVASSDIQIIEELSVPVVVNTNTRVYKSPSKSSDSERLKKGLRVNLLAQNGDWALIALNGQIGFTYIHYLTKVEEQEEPSKDFGVVYAEFDAYVCVDTLFAHQSPGAESKVLGSLNFGCRVQVQAYNDDWAYVQYKGNRGFMLRSGLSLKEPIVQTVSPTATPTPVPTPKPTPTPASDYLASNKSNEEKIYLFLTQEVGFNSAAACGVLSNIYSESGFRPTALNSSGGSYGICQWTGSRKTRLQNYCNEHGYDYTTLEGQLYFLKYELEQHYTSTQKYLKGVENTADGAYDAGYYWCYYFEVPANRASVSVKRGNTARNTYWSKYN